MFSVVDKNELIILASISSWFVSKFGLEISSPSLVVSDMANSIALVVISVIASCSCIVNVSLSIMSVCGIKRFSCWVDGVGIVGSVGVGSVGAGSVGVGSVGVGSVGVGGSGDGWSEGNRAVNSAFVSL